MSPQQAYDFWGNDMFRFQARGAQLVCPGISSYDTDRSQFTGIASGFTCKFDVEPRVKESWREDVLICLPQRAPSMGALA